MILLCVTQQLKTKDKIYLVFTTKEDSACLNIVVKINKGLDAFTSPSFNKGSQNRRRVIVQKGVC